MAAYLGSAAAELAPQVVPVSAHPQPAALPPPRAPVLALEGLAAGYEGAAVIRDLDLTVSAGEVVALLGANGAGKTTTLRAISGLVHPLEGRILYRGEDLARYSASARARLGIAHVPEGRGLFFGLTVAEHFRLGHRGRDAQRGDRLRVLPRPRRAARPPRRAALRR